MKDESVHDQPSASGNVAADDQASDPGHDHEHGIERRGTFWRQPQLVVLYLAGVLFFAGLGLQFAAPERFNLLLARILGYRLDLVGVLYLLTIVVASVYTVSNGLRAVVSLRLSIDFLISVALFGALVLGEFVEAASLAFLYGVAEVLEEYSLVKAEHSLEELLEMSPKRATVIRGKGERTLPVEEIEVGETVVVRPGEKVSMDGRITEGEAHLNEAPVTGESMPVKKQVGDRVFAGTLNRDGFVKFRVTKPADQNTLARIIELVREAEAHKAPSQQFVDRFASVYTPAVVVLSLFLGLVVPFVPGVSGGFSTWWLRAMALLVIACPCGLLISTPVTVVSGITSAARNGTLIRGGEPFERLGKLKAICLDKTGTLTRGKPSVSRLVSVNGAAPDELLRRAAAVEQRSEHHLARAIVKEARDRKLDLPEVSDFQSHTGMGVSGRIDGEEFFVGKPGWFSRSDFNRGEHEFGGGETLVHVGVRDRLEGIIVIEDRIRPEAPDAIQRLKDRGMEVAMITGDSEQTASRIATQLGIDHYHGGLLPEDKVEEIKKLRERHGPIAMVGDGINDAPALAAADVGIAMGAAGTDTALETADIALLGDNLSRLPYVVNLSQTGERIIKQNITASMGIKLALGLGVIPGWVNLIMAVLIGDMGVAFGITANAMRLRGLGAVEPRVEEAGGVDERAGVHEV